MIGAQPLKDRVAVVTGATGGMGQVIALELVRLGAHVVTIARDPARAATLTARAREASGEARLDVIPGDLSRRDDVRAAALAIADRHEAVHVLVNNAGAHFPDRRLSVDGVELHIAVDYLAAFGLTALLEAPLRRGSARVVNVASDTINDTRQLKLPGRRRPVTLDVEALRDLRSLNPARGFVPFEAYARAKLLTVMAGYDFAARWASDGVLVNSVHPGIVATDIIDDLVPLLLRPFGALIRRFMLSAEDGAAAALRLATQPGVGTGGYFVRDTPASTPDVSHDSAARNALRTVSEAYFELRRPGHRTGSGSSPKRGL